LSGILGFLAFPPFEFSILGWFCLVPLLMAIKNSTIKGAFFYSYLAGVVFFGGLLYWLVNVTVPGTVVLVLLLSTMYGLFGVITAHVLKYSMDLLILPFIWVMTEYIRSHFLTGFPWGLLGYTQYKSINLIQIADIAGTYGLSFLMVAFNVSVFAMLARRARRIAYMAVTLFFLVLVSTYGVYRTDNFFTRGNAKISVIQGNIPQEFKWDPGYAEGIMRVYAGLTEQAAMDDPDLIIWPETSYPYLTDGSEGSTGEIKELALKVDSPILAGVVFEEDGAYYNSAMLFRPRGEPVVYHKTHLVPFGEYVPLEERLSFLRRHINKPIGDFEKGGIYTLFPMERTSYFPYTEGVKARQINFYKCGTLICFEDIFPYITREFVKRGADFMVNITNDAWFGKTAAARQHMQASVFRAVENRVPVVRAANTGISCFIDALGRVSPGVVSEGEETFVEGFATGSIDMYPARSYYTLYGDVFAYFCIFMSILLFATEAFFLWRDKASRPE